MARIDKATVDKILDATNIVEVVGDFVSLKKRGSNWWGLCPFHSDRSPSFSVSPSRGIFKCFACGKAGSAVSFLMETEKMTYVEALKWLGRKYNIDVKERELTSEEKETEAARESMFAVNEFALKHFEKTLRDTEDGRDIGLAYFRERGISDAMIEKFHLGYALEKSDDLYKNALAAGFSEKYLVDTGLVIKTERGTCYDRFKGRVIYPVHSLSGRVVAFGGRTLKKEKTIAKYVNSPESIIYSKSHELYGMYQARNAIARKKQCIMVEGYMDVISMHQSGVENVVASSGTSLTDGQIRMIKRFADEVTLIYDADPAGIKASLRGINMLLGAGLALKVVLLPPGDDPDSFAQHHSSTEVEEYIEANKQDMIGFKVDVLLKDAGSDPRARSEAINDILQSIALIPDLVERSIYLEECSRKVGVSVDVLQRQLKRFTLAKAEERYKQQQRQQARESLGDIDNGKPGEQTPTQPAQGGQPMAEPTIKVPKAVQVAERELIKHVLRQGMLYMCESYSEGSKESQPMSVLDYINYDLSRDDVNFATPAYKAIWQKAIELRDTIWPTEKANFERQLNAIRQKGLEEGHEQIRQSGGDTQQIQELEEALNERLQKDYDMAMDEFSATFIHKMLMRTDNSKMIRLVAELTTDSVVLSKMFKVEDQREEARRLLPIAVAGLKNALLKERLKELQEQIIAEKDEQRSSELMDKYREIKLISMDFDKFNGEIVILP